MSLPEVPVFRAKVRTVAAALTVALALSPALCMSGTVPGLEKNPALSSVRAWLVTSSDAPRHLPVEPPSAAGVSGDRLYSTGERGRKDVRSETRTSTGPANRQQLIAALSGEQEHGHSASGASGGSGTQGAASSGDGQGSATFKVQPRYSYYWDTDDNIVNRYGIALGATKGRWLLTLDGQYISAKDSLRNGDAAVVLMTGYARLTSTLGLGGGIGGVTMKGSSTATSLIGNIKSDLNVLSGNVTLYVGREALPDTAALINNNIRYSVLSLSVTQRPIEPLSVTARYDYRDYSDHNFASDIQISVAGALSKQPLATAGYSFRYLNFDRQTGSGYFDPDIFVSNQLFATLNGESGRVFYFLQPFVGYQTYSRFGEKKNEFYGGGLGSIGVKFSGKAALELNAEGGNYALGTASGFGYYLIGLRFDASL